MATISLIAYNVLGQKVQELVNAVMPAGRCAVTFNAARLSSGVYSYTLRAGDAVMTKKLTIVI